MQEQQQEQESASYAFMLGVIELGFQISLIPYRSHPLLSIELSELGLLYEYLYAVRVPTNYRIIE